MKTVTDFFDSGAQRYPDRICVQNADLRFTYAEAENASHALGFALQQMSLSNSPVGILAPNHPLTFITMLGTMRSGASYVPLNVRDSIDTLIWFMQFVSLGGLVLDSSMAQHAERFRKEVPSLKIIIGLNEPIDELSISKLCSDNANQQCETGRELDDTAIIKSSGGTTGKPKAIIQTHRALLALYRTTNRFAQHEKPPVHLVIAPMTHAAGATMLILSKQGARNIISPSADPAVILEQIEREGVTFMFTPPTLLYRLLAHPDAKTRDCSSLEFVRYGAAPMSTEKLREGLVLWGPIFMQSYGQAEVPSVITCLTRDDHSRDGDHLGSAGRPTGACEVGLMDEQGNLLGAGERGEIVVRGELVTPGYYNNPEATAEVKKFGWHHTGDVGMFDKNGYLHIVDRIKDMIISGGFNIYPSEIEQLIWSHEAVHDCAVVGLPDPDWGERVTAVIEVKQGSRVEAEEIIAMCRDRLGSLKTPKQVEFWPTLPRSAVGKVLKKDIKSKMIDQAG